MKLATKSKNYPNKLMLYVKDLAKMRTTQDTTVEWYVRGKYENTYNIKDILALVDARAGMFRTLGRTKWIEFDYSQLTPVLPQQAAPATKTLQLKNTYNSAELTFIRKLIDEGFIKV